MVKLNYSAVLDLCVSYARSFLCRVHPCVSCLSSGFQDSHLTHGTVPMRTDVMSLLVVTLPLWFIYLICSGYLTDL